MNTSIPFVKPRKLPFKLFIAALFLLSCSQATLAQRYNFTQYNIEDGLIQSQVRYFTQSPSRHLWIATQGGVSRFDGTQFNSLTRTENGLADMATTALISDKKGIIYIGTKNGLSVYDGKKIRNFRLADTESHSWIKCLVKDKNDRIYGLVNERIFIFSGNKIQLLKNTEFSNDNVTALTTDRNGLIYVAVWGKGIYRLNNSAWQLKVSLPEMSKPAMVRQLQFDIQQHDKLWILTAEKILISQKNKLEQVSNSTLNSAGTFLLSLAQDNQSNLWIGTSMGAYCIRAQSTIYFNSENGFTDNAVNQIFRDQENNLWFATEGAGIYKYNGDQTMILDKGQGLSNEVVMSFANDPQGNLWLLSFGGSMVKLKDGKLISINLPVPDSISYRISQLFNDKDGNIWIATLGAGLWKYDGKAFKSFHDQPGKVPKVIRHIIQDRYGGIWLATPTGCYIFYNGKFTHVKDFNAIAVGVLEIGQDSVLVSSDKSLFLIIGKNHQIQKISSKEIKESVPYCMTFYKGLVFLGTGENGIWVWNLNKKTFKNLTRKEGLYSNTIYSLIADKTGNIWAGTGRGINKIKINSAGNNFDILGAEYSQRIIVECNQNAMFLNRDKLWVGTTKGALVFDLKPNKVITEKPHIVLQSVKLFNSVIKNKEQSYSSLDGFYLPKDLQIAYRKNHINLNFKAIYLSNPAEVLYQYRLVGLDDIFSVPGSNSSVNYQSLAPGDYVFEARAVTRSGLISDNMLRFPFSVKPAFYQTLPFRIGFILFLILCGIGLQAYLHRLKNRKLQLIENLKREERLKARRQTAEDFHDDLGNKLTRISILTDILNTRLNGEHEEEKHLIGQIKENASSLYRGTKDILWALDPKSDNLFEILSHISEFGMELFQDTPVEFNFKGIDEQFSNIKFPMEYSRNISMIFKESLNNILRHANARHVNFQVTDLEKSVEISLKDDGVGFNPQPTLKGSGLTNIAVRARRIGARLTLDSSIGKGTTITLSILKDLKPAV
ncbi:ligand-binding sensor domain-containing protein [Daejeonella oryzae]|uniref:ligand-binding sensor domain-containing protein n=1 Tax=Daejeonella oryzae TaxID=1122943 RepID=UPI000423413B|nr:sensor histidine kinase [Daejeonella oryzae]